MSAPQKWTEEQVERLRKWWSEGYSASQIARAFDCGFTRNAIIGKVTRLGLPRRSQLTFVKSGGRIHALNVVSGRTSARKVAKRQKRRHTVRSQLAERRVEILSITPPSAVSFFDVRDGQCKYPIGDWSAPVDRRFFCGAPSQERSAYCPDHHAVCWVPVRRKASLREAA
jgi:GcrA cell cycle regulator